MGGNFTESVVVSTKSYGKKPHSVHHKKYGHLAGFWFALVPICFTHILQDNFLASLGWRHWNNLNIGISYIDGLTQDCSDYSALEMELQKSCGKASI